MVQWQCLSDQNCTYVASTLSSLGIRTFAEVKARSASTSAAEFKTKSKGEIIFFW